MLTIGSTVSPMLAYPSRPFDSADFIFEVKYDGTRGIGYLRHGTLRLLNRRGNYFEHRFPDLAGIPDRFRARDAIVDGEVVVFDDRGVSDFNRLQLREANNQSTRVALLARRYPATFVAYDLLLLDDRDRTREPLSERRALLERIASEDGRLLLSPFVRGEGRSFFRAVTAIEGTEGLMAKRLASPYRLGERSRDWRKIKRSTEIDCFVVGLTRGVGPAPFGALALATNVNGRPKFIGKVGTGFDHPTMEKISALARRHPRRTTAVELPPGVAREIVLLTEPFVVEVSALRVTAGPHLRAPSFRRLRPDKDPTECSLP